MKNEFSTNSANQLARIFYDMIDLSKQVYESLGPAQYGRLQKKSGKGPIQGRTSNRLSGKPLVLFLNDFKNRDLLEYYVRLESQSFYSTQLQGD